MLENKLREAAGFEQRPEPAFSNLSAILGLLDAGFDRTDILPSVRRQARSAKKRGYSIDTWSYFVKGIRQDKVQRNEAANDSVSPPNGEVKPQFTEEEKRQILERGWVRKLEFFRDHEVWKHPDDPKDIPREFRERWWKENPPINIGPRKPGQHGNQPT